MGKSDANLEQYIIDIGKGDKNALADLYNTSAVSVYSYALSILKNSYDAEDILQDCFVNIWNSAASYTSKGKPMAWVITITKNLCLMKIRSDKKYSDIPEENWDRDLNLQSVTDFESKILLQECMDKLTSEERETVILHGITGLKFREIAEINNEPLSSVLSRYHRAIKKLKKLCEEGCNE